MTRLYLITGFLGAGKTTFLQNFVRLFPDKKIALIINEFGKSGVDGTLLRELEIAMAEINNGSIFCACKLEQFEHTLAQMLRQKPDLIFVEASGLSDPTAVKGILNQAVYSDLEYTGAICLVDAMRFHKVYQTARVCRTQLAISDLVLINKTDKATREQIDEITGIVKAQRPERPVYETTFGWFERAWLDTMGQPAGEETGGHVRDITLQKLILRTEGFDFDAMEAFLKMFAGDTYRIKGFLKLREGIFFADCVGPIVELRPYSGPVTEENCLNVLYGNGLPARKSIKAAREHFPAYQIEIK